MTDDIRKRMKSNATNIASYVINSVCDFKNELLSLEQENLKLKRKIEKLKTINQSLQDKCNFLNEEIEEKNSTIDKFKNYISSDKICYNCHHSIICQNMAKLCVYCLKLVCPCCIDFCDKTQECIICICSSCLTLYDGCPDHLKLPNRDIILKKYHEKRYSI